MSLQRDKGADEGSLAALKAALAERTRELEEAREREAATSEILKLISSSQGRLGPVFHAILVKAVGLCGAKFGHLQLYHDEAFHPAAEVNSPSELTEFHKRRGAFRPEAGTLLDRVLRTRQPTHVADVGGNDLVHGAAARFGGARSIVIVPMLKDGDLIGAITIFRQDVRPFTDKQVDLVTTFAAQAVIAIENARLMSEQREALDRQTATSEVLKVIASSPTDVQPVFDAIAHSAMRLFRGQSATVTRVVGDEIHLAALTAGNKAGIEAVRSSFPSALSSQGIHSRVARSGAPAFRFDIENEPDVSASVKELARARGYRSILVVPMLRDSVAIGTIGVTRPEAGAFSDDQIALLSSFADQAVIAIENARLFAAEQQRTKELGEALEQQTATSEVLKVISSSPGELDPVFQAMLENATRICDAKFGMMHRYENGAFHTVAVLNAPQALAEHVRRRGSFQPPAGSPLGRLMQMRAPIYTADETAEAIPGVAARLGGARSLIAMPMLKENELIGAFVIYRQEVRPFTEKQIELVENFAAQAVIAIENARLLSELRETLERQTATSEVLKVISSSPGELAPVFKAMLENATKLCGAEFGTLGLFDGEFFGNVALHNVPEGLTRMRDRKRWRPHPQSGLGRVAATRRFVHIDDLRTQPPYLEGDPAVVEISDTGGARTIVTVPMLKENELIGTMSVYRQEVRPFTDKQIELLSNFADQAVIAIENARLLSELRETLDRQTATSEVLGVISSSPGELEPVFSTMLENAARICEAKFANLFLYSESENAFRLAAKKNAPAAYAERWAENPVLTLDENPRNPLARLAQTKRLVAILDLKSEPGYTDRDPRFVALVEAAGARTHILIPMLKEGALIGAIAVYRQEVRAFSEKQIELLTNFAAQAVIAIENTRLLSELRETLERQTATSEVLRVISSSPGAVKPVFDSILANATRICEAEFGTLMLCEGDGLRAVALHGGRAAYAEQRQREPVIRPAPNVPVRRALNTRQVQHVADLRTEPAYIERDTAIVTMVEAAGARTFLAVPMLKDNEAVGAIVIYRQEVRPFADKQIELVQNFAAQAVIAIENARLLSELRESLEQQTATSEVLKSSAVRRASLSRCSRPCWRTHRASATPNSATCGYRKTAGSYWRRLTAYRPHITSIFKWALSPIPVRAFRPPVLQAPSERSTLPICARTRHISTVIRSRWSASKSSRFAPCSLCPC